MTRLNLEWLETFTTVIRLGSFSAAANQLNLSQPAVSQHMRQLEHHMGVRLAERSGKTLRPTPAGTLLLHKIVQIQQVLEETHQIIADYTEDVIGHVLLGTGATACIHLLPAVLGQLRLDYPRLTVGVCTGNTREIVQSVIDNRIDAGLVALPVTTNSLDITPVLEEELVAISNMPMVSGPMSPALLQAQPLILFETGSSTRALIESWFADGSLIPQPVMELGSIEAIKEMVATGLGVSIVPRMSVTRPTDAERYHVLALNPPLMRKLAVVTRHDKPVNKVLRLVLERIKASAETITSP
ncbi:MULTISPECIES: LysR family transcriptional regulator [Dickeya]|uniref:Hydrogen peroxide-inducible genes activator n=1 Tax=Dickeya aquatica TaxID=1401087 RepID=A0A375AD94_9GAMM|nr:MULTISPECIES: LysR family transcriptional regulator [Dickeya]SLM64088.1 Hydrogen peroxide-inducible genes activator [Dickeya aquatica]